MTNILIAIGTPSSIFLMIYIQLRIHRYNLNKEERNNRKIKTAGAELLSRTSQQIVANHIII